MTLLSNRLLFATTLLVSLALTGGATRAYAQGWLADRSRTEGPGIRLGDFELHPGIGVELGYDSNLYYTNDDAMLPIPPRRDSAILRVTPHFYVSTIGAQRHREGEASEDQQTQPDVTFRAGINASYYEYFNDERRRNLSLDGSFALNILPGRTVSFSITDQFSRSIRPFAENTFETSTARDQNRAGVDVTFSTTGNVFQVRAGYRFGLDYFEGERFRYGNTFQHRVELQETFRFLPQTAIVHETSVEYRDYFEPRRTTDPVAVFDGTLVQSRIGLNGAITPEVSLLGMFGYAAGFFDSNLPGYDQDYESVVAQAQLGWQIQENMRLGVGYMRSFNPSFVGNYASSDRGYANFNMMIGGSFLLGLDAGVAYLDFGQIVDPSGAPVGSSTERTDVRVDASLFGEYRFTDWLGVSGTVTYVGDFTDFRYDVATSPTMTITDPAGYHKLELWLGVRVFY